MLKAILFDLGGTLFYEGGGPLPYAYEVLDNLHTNYWLGIISNTDSARLPEIKHMLRKNDMLLFFDTIIISSEVEYRKPDKEIFNIALKELGVAPHEAVMVGDRISTDIIGGNRAGLHTILIKWNDMYNEEMTDEIMRPKYTIYSLRNLFSMIDNIDESQSSDP